MWSKTLLDASFRGVTFDCASIEDSFDIAVAEHVFPYVAGAETEDMGRGPRKVSVQALFYGDDYEERLKAFIVKLETPGAGELIHPVFGSFKDAQVTRGSIHHEADAIDQATVTFELTESTAGKPFFAQQSAGQKAASVTQQAQAARSASAWTLGNVITKLQALNPMSQLTALRQNLLAPIFKIKAIVGGVISAGLDVIYYPQSWANDLTALASGVMNVGGFTTETLLDDYKYSVNRLTQVLETGSTVVTVNSSGSTVTTTLADGSAVNHELAAGSTVTATQISGPMATITSQTAAGAVENTVLASGSSIPVIAVDTPTEAGVIQATALHCLVERAATIAETTAAVLQSETQTATLTNVDIESIANIARTELESTIELVRASYPVDVSRPIIESLKATALAIQVSAQAVIVVRPPLITRQVIVPAPLRVLAHRWYGDHERALELQRLNSLANPNFLQATDQLSAYAS